MSRSLETEVKDFRHLDHMMHSKEERLLRKKLISLGANKNFANSTVVHQKSI